MTMPMTGPPVVLASGSTARAAMLRSAGVRFSVVRPAVDEAALKETMREAGASAEDTATALAELKAAQVAPRVAPDAIVIASDQVLVCDGAWFDKPGDRAAARQQLGRLRGRRHQLVSAVVGVRAAARIGQHVSTASLWMRPFDDAFLERYLELAGDAVTASVGGYQLEGVGAQLFSRVEGDWFTIMGMPLLPVLQWLRDHRVLAG